MTLLSVPSFVPTDSFKIYKMSANLQIDHFDSTTIVQSDNDHHHQLNQDTSKQNYSNCKHIA